MNPIATEAKSWPFEQARALLRALIAKRLHADVKVAHEHLRAGRIAEVVALLGTAPVVFETGYGPSGPPHIGTFAEVVRTSWVRRAFEELTGMSTLLVAFSDDYDGFRRVPDGMPDSMNEHLGYALTTVPDPFGEHQSFGDRNNALLRGFLDRFHFTDIDFVSSTESYQSGVFDETLLKVWDNYQAIMDVMIPTLGAERAATYSPFMPLDALGRVLQVPVRLGQERGTIVYESPTGTVLSRVTGGEAKLQWKIDWAMRWAALGIDYEMHGKDLIESQQISSKVCRILGVEPPLTYFYELFLDAEGQKISKSKGNGLSMEDFLSYTIPPALEHFMFGSPRSASRLHHGVIGRSTDDYLKALKAYPALGDRQRLDSPVWHIHRGNPPIHETDISYGLLINLATVTAAPSGDVLTRHMGGLDDLSESDSVLVQSMIDGAVAYVGDHVERSVRSPTPMEETALSDLATRLEAMEDVSAEDYQTVVYQVGKDHGFDPLRSWFQCLYEVLLGSSDGPRFGNFIAAYGRRETIDLIAAL